MKKLSVRTFTTVLGIGLISVLLASCGGMESGQQATESSIEIDKKLSSSEDDLTTDTDEATQPAPITGAKVDKKSPSPENKMSTKGEYISYQSYVQEVEQYTNSRVVFFFNASWCSTCKVARDNFESSLDEIPTDMTIVVVDFDNSNELRKKYGVTYQHTFVHIDSNGDAIKKWSGTTTIAALVNQTV
jgi:thiol-disulfide isomerase/thioredoxin